MKCSQACCPIEYKPLFIEPNYQNGSRHKVVITMFLQVHYAMINAIPDAIPEVMRNKALMSPSGKCCSTS